MNEGLGFTRLLPNSVEILHYDGMVVGKVLWRDWRELYQNKGYPISSTEAKTLDSHPVILSALCLLG